MRDTFGLPLEYEERIGHGGARIAFLDPASTGNVLIELAELPLREAEGACGILHK